MLRENIQLSGHSEHLSYQFFTPQSSRKRALFLNEYSTKLEAYRLHKAGSIESNPT
jgi:hypothetical protein